MVAFGKATGLSGDTLYLDVNQDIGSQLLPFDQIVKIAAANSPLLKYQDEVINSLNAATAVTRSQLLQNLTGFGNYSGGNQTLLATGVPDANGRTGSIGQLTNGWRVGIDARISLYDLFGRKHQIRQAEATQQAGERQKDVVLLQLKRELITIYQDMLTAQQVLKIRLLDEQASLTAYRIAEVELQKGRLSAELMANATTRYVETKSISEQVKGEFLKNVHTFEALVGVPIQRLKRN
ncbi:TolC family protein [Fibrella sp. HMF5335]|uniref:TolC family protein n=2 Tax=Fibrella rubiginis TaxID=2817060 RepID=A0A939GFH6_9BACT|nr:TolC family protein [Fibrella rubiginis]